ncbi:hypothetical protein CALVIDRAFT_537323 [Calocera viscosa TUFC12733]|uniref:F-box domain-containing protein n=1 Tax=Calocera viscosa (strain TUFC12733) TaxID=1330018 RepID=A0A167LXH0_CALVF|nr:hypothetical protein CALVIDRAFT_537323 [Calocera viscosa TUFC12733]
MDSPALKAMNEDLWRCIFEKIVDEAQRPSVIPPLMYVCKEWTIAAEPLLYRYLHFTNATSISQCHQVLVWKAIQGSFPGKAARSFVLAGSFQMEIDRILHYTPNLVTFNAAGSRLGSNSLEMLAQVGSHSLKDLNVTLGGEGSDGALQLALLGRFVALKKLAVEVSGLNGISELSKMKAPSFELPSLAVLVLRCFSKEPLSPVFNFLSRCRFPVLKMLLLVLPNLGPAPTGCTDSAALIPFFNNIGAQLSDLTLHTPIAEDAPRLLFPLMENLRSVCFANSTVPQGAIRFLPESVVHLRFLMNLGVREQVHALLDCLDQLSKGDYQHSISDVLIASSTSEPFQWRTISAASRTLAGELMTRSVLLASQGIRVKDRNNKWIGELS